ncbi:MAG TPA: DUF4251 domain-containing protein [Mucilaginibacter sp.]|nr:DUF4251 domain-containing protein [Mucilaginibacter sp.]
MKNLKKLLLMLLTAFIGLPLAVRAQSQKPDAKTEKVKALLDERNFIFEATYVIPQTGISKSLTYGYDMTVSKDTVTAYLPYYGRVTLPPVDPTDGGVKFTTISFDYKTIPKKKGYEILITPKDIMEQSGSKDVRYVRINVSLNGYATLQVISNNRDPISYNGTIVPRESKK